MAKKTRLLPKPAPIVSSVSDSLFIFHGDTPGQYDDALVHDCRASIFTFQVSE